MQSDTPTVQTSGPATQPNSLDSEWFRISDIPEGSARLVGNVAVFNVAGHLCATQAKCPHKYGPLIEGHIAGSTVTCPWHGSEFDVCTGAVLRGPAVKPLQTYRVVVEGERARVENMQQTDAK
ncbi:Rieske (2Fe-2S) protein [Terriglobus roseus]|uniref:Nitrite reductase (NADH) small subunit n=1 Tax=Terriglobus roseus TaxID=392734 RepID=A0A1G7NXT5_9BACT|nr:Rieske (2Fe-2S) protein [Terriglobus roseus]SDF78898.1 nitrite reductase (NADH) small subunit [Terriglobus roseus]